MKSQFEFSPGSMAERHLIADADSLRTTITGLRAEKVWLRDKVEQAEGGARMLRQELDAASKREKTALALAERRKEALELARDYVRSIAYALHCNVPEHHSKAGFETCGREECQMFARFDTDVCAAIAAEALEEKR